MTTESHMPNDQTQAMVDKNTNAIKTTTQDISAPIAEAQALLDANIKIVSETMRALVRTISSQENYISVLTEQVQKLNEDLLTTREAYSIELTEARGLLDLLSKEKDQEKKTAQKPRINAASLNNQDITVDKILHTQMAPSVYEQGTGLIAPGETYCKRSIEYIETDLRAMGSSLFPLLKSFEGVVFGSSRYDPIELFKCNQLAVLHEWGASIFSDMDTNEPTIQHLLRPEGTQLTQSGSIQLLNLLDRRLEEINQALEK